MLLTAKTLRFCTAHMICRRISMMHRRRRIKRWNSTTFKVSGTATYLAGLSDGTFAFSGLFDGSASAVDGCLLRPRLKLVGSRVLCGGRVRDRQTGEDCVVKTCVLRRVVSCQRGRVDVIFGASRRGD